MIAILTDKPNVGKEIARVMGAHKRENGYCTGNGYMVTWTFGNMLSLAMPKDYGTARLAREDFPLKPEPFRLMVKHVKTDTGWVPDIHAVLQLKVIEKVFAACDSIIVATDACREGEMLFRYLYQYLGCTLPYSRLWISSLTDAAIRKGMENLYPASLFDRMYLAADSRNKADWLLGMNGSYALCKATGLGNNSLGRVQTPVLAAISARYRERERFVQTESWPVHITISKKGHILKMRCTEKTDNKDFAEQVNQECKDAGKIYISKIDRQVKEMVSPALYNLAELQKEANRLHGLTAIQVQDITQFLYEKKLISYPRTSSRYLTEDVYETLPDVMEKVLQWKEFKPYAASMGINISTLSRNVVNEERVTEHPAIIITDVYPEGLNREEMQVYTLILGRMLEAFMPPCKVEYTTVDARCAGYTFRSQTYRILEKGWYNIFERESAIAGPEWKKMECPGLEEGETVPVTGYSLGHRKELPVNPYTDSELIDYMENAGLGTVTTRAGIIRTLVARKYIRYSGKYIIPTPKGLFFHETLKGMKITEAALTSGWERKLARIEQGEMTQKEFLDEVLLLAEQVTEEIFSKYMKTE